MGVHKFSLCFGACRLGSFELISSYLFNGCHAYCINNSGSVILVSVFLSVVVTIEHGISESNKGLKFECRSITDLRHNLTQSALVKQAYC